MSEAGSIELSTRLALSLSELAAALGCSENHARAMITDGLPHVRSGRRLLFPVREVTAWLGEKAEEERGRGDGIVEEMLRAES